MKKLNIAADQREIFVETNEGREGIELHDYQQSSLCEDCRFDMSHLRKLNQARLDEGRTG